MMAVDVIKQLDGHTEKTCSLLSVDASLHEPSRSRVTQMQKMLKRRHLTFDLSATIKRMVKLKSVGGLTGSAEMSPTTSEIKGKIATDIDKDSLLDACESKAAADE